MVINKTETLTRKIVTALFGKKKEDDNEFDPKDAFDDDEDEPDDENEGT